MILVVGYLQQEEEEEEEEEDISGKMPGKHQQILLKKKTPALETSHIIRKILQPETGGLNCGVHQRFSGEVPGEKKPVIRDYVVVVNISIMVATSTYCYIMIQSS
jgi:hypothetical protein